MTRIPQLLLATAALGLTTTLAFAQDATVPDVSAATQARTMAQRQVQDTSLGHDPASYPVRAMAQAMQFAQTQADAPMHAGARAHASGMPAERPQASASGTCHAGEAAGARGSMTAAGRGAIGHGAQAQAHVQGQGRGQGQGQRARQHLHEPSAGTPTRASAAAHARPEGARPNGPRNE